ncbi:MAG: hypothetical protein E7015_03110 [Alphaproteobacteria bacterium]|nr:hypothetical protein [Alphaproteobacteria bacterium]
MPTQNNTQDQKSAFSNFKMPQLDMEAITDSYKKNLEILGLMSKMSVEVCNGIVKLQAAFLKQMTMDMGTIFSKTSKPSEVFSQLSDITKDAMTKAFNNSKQISEMLVSSNSELTQALTKRMKESMEEAKNMIKK